ncbi:MAG: NYN domain-containing protein [Promethearchaeia archaeon]
MSKIILFIDNSNLFHQFQKLNFKCDYKKLKDEIANGRKIVDARIYTGLMYPVKKKDKAYLSKLGHLGFKVVTRSIKVAPNGRKVEKRIDVLMAVDIISAVFQMKFDTIVLISGDGDFVPVAKKLNELNRDLEIWSFKDLLSKHLKSVVGNKKCYYIDSILEKIKLE